MPKYWNFRIILAIDPQLDGHCVGYAKSKGRRCGNHLGRDNRKEANRIINRIDQQKTVERADFEKLAEAMLCLYKHNCATQPTYSQVVEVTNEWQATFQGHVERMKRKQSVARRSSTIKHARRDAPAAKTLNTDLEKMIKQIGLTQKAVAVEADMAGKATIPESPLMQDSKADDPFMNDKDAVQRLPSRFESRLSRNSEEPSTSLRTEIDTLLQNQTSSKLPLQASDFPPPPDTALETCTSSQKKSMPEMAAQFHSTLEDLAAKITTHNFALPVEMGSNVAQSIATNTKPIPTNLTYSKSSAGDTSPRTFNFELPAEAKSSTLKLTQRLWSIEDENTPDSTARYESNAGTSLAFPTSQYLARENVFLLSGAFTPKEPIPSTLTDPISQETIEAHNSEHPVLAGNSDQESLPASDIPSIPEPLPPVSTDTLSQETPSTPALPLSSEKVGSLEMLDRLDQKTLPPYNLGFIPQSLDSRGSPPAKVLIPMKSVEKLSRVGPSSKYDLRTQVSDSDNRPKEQFRDSISPNTSSRAKPAEKFSGFEFGSKYVVPPTSFDFDTWSKFSSAARLSDKISIWDRLNTESVLKSDENLVIGEASGSKPENSEKRLEQDETPYELLSETAAKELKAHVEEPESPYEQPRTPSMVPQTVEKNGLLTPESTPEVVKFSLDIAEDLANPEATSKFFQQQERGASFSITEACTNLTPQPTPESDSAPCPPSQELFGLADVKPSRLYRPRPLTRQDDAFLTPPASPKALHSGEHLESLLPSTSYERSQAVIRRKPVPRPTRVESTEQQEAACQICGQNVQESAECCQCEDQEQGEIESKRAGIATSGGRRQRWRKSAAKRVIEMKTKTVTSVTKAADLIVARLEPDGRHVE